jgi:UDP-glucose 4-epimerase
VYNIGTGRETSINELIETLEQFEKKALQAEQQSPWPNDIRRISADTRLARDELGFEPEVSLRDGLARTVDFFRGI